MAVERMISVSDPPRDHREEGQQCRSEIPQTRPSCAAAADATTSANSNVSQASEVAGSATLTVNANSSDDALQASLEAPQSEQQQQQHQHVASLDFCSSGSSGSCSAWPRHNLQQQQQQQQHTGIHGIDIRITAASSGRAATMSQKMLDSIGQHECHRIHRGGNFAMTTPVSPALSFCSTSGMQLTTTASTSVASLSLSNEMTMSPCTQQQQQQQQRRRATFGCISSTPSMMLTAVGYGAEEEASACTPSHQHMFGVMNRRRDLDYSDGQPSPRRSSNDSGGPPSINAGGDEASLDGQRDRSTGALLPLSSYHKSDLRFVREGIGVLLPLIGSPAAGGAMVSVPMRKAPPPLSSSHVSHQQQLAGGYWGGRRRLSGAPPPDHQKRPPTLDDPFADKESLFASGVTVEDYDDDDDDALERCTVLPMAE
jgi:hypothetical protein